MKRSSDDVCVCTHTQTHTRTLVINELHVSDTRERGDSNASQQTLSAISADRSRRAYIDFASTCEAFTKTLLCLNSNQSGILSKSRSPCFHTEFPQNFMYTCACELLSKQARANEGTHLILCLVYSFMSFHS